jgi:hypothetical protein
MRRFTKIEDSASTLMVVEIIEILGFGPFPTADRHYRMTEKCAMVTSYKRLAPTKGNDEYVSGADATRIIGCAPSHLAKLADDGQVGTWSVPGSRKRYSRKDCERVRDAAFAPARSK